MQDWPHRKRHNDPPAQISFWVIVSGKASDFKLQPKDIIYVSPRPFVRVEELADLATTAFIQGLITAWVDVKLVNPFPS
ncbi:MAG: hypothetical protein ACLQVY_09225 [Limisphaerales bacterium]